MAEITSGKSPLDEQLTALFQLAQEIRAPVIEQALAIEGLIEDILAHHFCPDEDRRGLLFSLLLNDADFRFSTKTRILEKLLKLKYKNLIDKHNDLIERIDKIRRFRNRLAHAMLDSSEAFLEKEHSDRIQLVFYEDGRKKQQIVTAQERNERLAECTKAVVALIEIQTAIKDRNKPVGESTDAM